MFPGGQKLPRSQSGVQRRVVLLEHTVVRVPFVWPLPSPVLPKPPQEVEEELGIERV